jgi:hypothetical protein
MPSTLRNVSLASEQSGIQQLYLVVGDSKFHIPPEEFFGSLGFKPEKVQLVAPGTLSRFIDKPLRPAPATRPSDVFFDCQGPDVLGNLFYNCQDSHSILQRDIVVAGWLSARVENEPDSPSVNVANNGIEDIHYNLRLDPVFVDRMYGPDGISLRLDGKAFPGNPPEKATPVPFAAGPPLQPGGPNTNTFNSWTLPGNGENEDIHGELNVWHTRNTADIFHKAIVGRGPAPAGWRNLTLGTGDTDAWFAFDPLNPDGGPRPLQAGEYVIMRGTLWEDSTHGEVDALWDLGRTRNHGWLEMHPPDWVVRVRQPHPNAHITRYREWVRAELASGATAQFDARANPGPPFYTSAFGRISQVRDVHLLEDIRPAMRNGPSSTRTTIQPGYVDVGATVTSSSSDVAGQGRWHGTWLVEWSEVDFRDTVWIDDEVPAGALGLDGGEGWHWITANPKPFLGTRSHESPLASGIHWHGLSGVPLPGVTFPARTFFNDVLYATVWLDPDAPPDEILLQWHGDLATDAEHRAFWGADIIPWGIPGTTSRLPRGPLPFTGEWVRLEVSADTVGLGDATIGGVTFAVSGGRAVWDRTGIGRPG